MTNYKELWVHANILIYHEYIWKIGKCLLILIIITVFIKVRKICYLIKYKVQFKSRKKV